MIFKFVNSFGTHCSEFIGLFINKLKMALIRKIKGSVKSHTLQNLQCLK